MHARRDEAGDSGPSFGFTMTGRTRALLTAVASGRVEMVCSCEPDLLIDGCWCCDQYAAHQLAHEGLIRPAVPGQLGQRVAAVLTESGASALAGVS